jgi:sialic acid synthase SpsE/spore coat polysaccharide biosynthesis protein SpsF (cytidylyltransferase family)
MSDDKAILSDIDIIAELANAHEGDRSRAIEMIESVSESVDAAKVQVFTADDVAVEAHENYELYTKLSLSTSDVTSLVETAHKNGIYLFADVIGDEGLSRVAETDVDGFKIHSSDLTNHRLIEKIARQNKPTLVSAGGASPVEIEAALSSFQQVSDAQLGLVYGFQNYPTELADTHLYRLRKLVNEFGDEYSVGYTSHVDGGTDDAKQLPAWAVAAGADFVEIHTTLDRSPESTDYYSSLEPDAFESMAANVKRAQTALGDDTISMSDSELEYRNGHKKRVVATRRLSPGEQIGEDDVALKRPQGSPEGAFSTREEAVGKTVRHTVEAEMPVRTTDVDYTVAATLACRAESTRLYGKPLQLVGEKSILSHQITQLQDVTAINEMVLAISDTSSKSAFIDFAETHDLSYVVGDEVDVLQRIIDAGDAVDADIAVRTTTENPFLYLENIDQLIDRVIVENADLAVCRNLPLGAFAEVISMPALKQSHEYGTDRHRSELVTSFILEHYESFTVIATDPPEALNRPDIRLTVDNPCDLILTRKIWDLMSDHEDSYNLESIVDYYHEHDLSSINEHKTDGTDEEISELAWHVYGDPNGRLNIVE